MRVEMGLLHTVAQIWYDLGINRTLTCKLARVKPRFYFKNPLEHWDKAGTETHAAIYTLNDNDMLSYSLTTMMCILTKE